MNAYLMSEMKAATGFTLIELVVVIVLLAILGVAAAPKLISLRKDALVSTLYAMRAAIDTAGTQTLALATVRDPCGIWLSGGWGQYRDGGAG